MKTLIGFMNLSKVCIKNMFVSNLLLNSLITVLQTSVCEDNES